MDRHGVAYLDGAILATALMHATAMLTSAGMTASEVLPDLLAQADSIGAILRAGVHAEPGRIRPVS
ncbi:hypothetical protein GCM10027445_45640 [Amycolatopsis endophytica]|uniref:Uncharacterized protein n=1 Tax=Amycolatopsis endophytica TaxID=860233 RepID=A0A853B135_9PSEU|nr:hypothetical protein [Amycolatopsis endophytica]NYI88544.1 hypothetical protein [Amycolatopsis endophytica]